MRLMGSVLALSVTAFLAAAPVPAQQTRPSFSAEAFAVRMSVAVNTALPRPLHVDDFTVYENGRKQEVAFFSEEPLPSDIFLMLDASNSMLQMDEKTKKIGFRPGVLDNMRRFVDILRPGDRMEVIWFTERNNTMQELTSDKSLLTAAIHDPTEEAETFLFRSIYVKLREIENLSKKKPAESRRRILAIITDGADRGSGISDDMLIQAARKSTASVYIFSLGVPEMPTDDKKARLRGSWLLNRICKESGGVLEEMSAAEELGASAKRITDEIAAEYTLGWSPNIPVGNDPWHHIQVAVRGVSSDRLRYRSGYLNR